MTVITPDRPTYVVAPVPDVEHGALARAVAQVEPGSLLMALVHMTGDLSLLDEYRDKLAAAGERVKAEGQQLDPGGYPDDVAAQVRALALKIFAEGMTPTVTVPDDETFRRMAEVCVNQPVGAEFVAHLREQAGFESSQRVVPVTRKPPSGLRVAVIGAGMVGLNAAIKLGEAGFGYHVFEKSGDIGGTWSRNTYPGAAVDTPSHFYSYSFELNPRWSKYYPVGPEYLDYMHGVARKYGLYEHISLNTTVVACTWSDGDQLWSVTVHDEEGVERTERFDAIVTATGVLNSAQIPDIPGLASFRGEIMHTAEWRHDVDMRDKRVVLLGTGCTAVQVVVNLVDQVRALDVVVRQPHWISPERAVRLDVPEAVQWGFEQIPYLHQWFRLKSFWLAGDNLYPIPRIDREWFATHVSASPANDAVMQACLQHMDNVLGDRPDLKAKLTPDFPPFAKRIVKDPGFLSALKREHVELHRASLREVTPDGVITSEGEFIPADVIVFATGFKLEFLSFLDVTGRNGLKLSEAWGDEDPRAYLGIAVPGFPNFFTTVGPNSAPNHGGGHNVLSEEQVHYIIECLQYLVENDLTTMEPTQAATDAYNTRVDEELDKTVWQHAKTATGYYRNKNGRAWLASPWRIVDYWSMLRAPNPADYQFTSERKA
ncbi:NAD(P)-binding domain-containing protein [Nocardia sp. NPDC052112]|uniref:flavin-containing monooxygenase n=1 Tax=Nocardia sp. NPDC052112 TaxID=3155646 RepID=UPI003440CE86